MILCPICGAITRVLKTRVMATSTHRRGGVAPARQIAKLRELSAELVVSAL